MSDSELGAWLQEGIVAAKAGERAQARELLQRVVEADERNARAWLWLSGVVTTLEDREVCLENVLALEPDNARARQGLEWVREQMAATPQIEPESPLPRVSGDEVRELERRLKVDFSDDTFDDPLLCVYCGQLTGETDRRCPHCRRSLYSAYFKRERATWLWVGWSVGVAEVFFTLAMIVVLVVMVMSAMTAAQVSPQPIEALQLLGVYFNAPGALPAVARAVMLDVLPASVFFVRLGYVVWMSVTLIGLPTRRRPFHLLYIGSLAIGAVVAYWSANLNREAMAPVGSQTPLLGIMQAAIYELLGVYVKVSTLLALMFLLLKLLLAFAMDDDFTRVSERLWCKIDHTVRESHAAFVRAKAYMQRDMWTLAAMYLRKAISLQPAVFDYYVALAEAYARLQRYPAGLDMLDQADRLQPDSAAVAGLREILNGQMRQSAEES